MKHHLSKLDLLSYALEGIQHRIGSHPAPCDYPDEIAELESHLKQVERRIKAVERGLAQHEDRRPSAVIVSIRGGAA